MIKEYNKRDYCIWSCKNCWDNVKSPLAYWTIGIVTLFAVAAFIASVVMFSNAGNVKVVQGYELTTCTLINARVIKLKDCYDICSEGGCIDDTYYTAVWNDTKGRSVILHPKSVPTEADASENIKEKQIGNTYPCMCNPNFSPMYPTVSELLHCDVWGACQLNVEQIQELKNNFNYTINTATILMWLSIPVLGIWLVVCVIAIVAAYCCK